MAEFCLDCFNKLIASKPVTEEDVVINFDVCEHCRQNKPCIVYLKTKEVRE